MIRMVLSLTLALLAGCGCAFTAASAMADDAPGPKTLMAEPGKLLVSDDLAQSPGAPWKVAKGKWEADAGGVRVSELADEKHGAVARHPLPTRNFVAQYSVKLDGAKQTSFSVNDGKGHCCRVTLSPASFGVQKDSHDHNQQDKQVKLDTRATPTTVGEWHTLVIEVLGPELVASLDGDRVALGSHDSIDVDKTNIGLTVAGDSACFKNLRVWEASAKPSWESTKAELKQRAAK